MTKVAIAGATGRMGRLLINAVCTAPDMVLCGALVSPENASLGKTVRESLGLPSDVRLSATLDALRDADVIIDFSSRCVTLSLLEFCAEQHIRLVIGTTGFSDEERAQITQAATKTAIVFAPNMSVGVNATFKLLSVAAKLLGDYDVEIVEMHHKHKADAPSGTALEMGRVIAKARDVDFKDVAVLGRVGQTGERVPGSIGFAALRGGDVVGDHTVIFAGTGERIEISHKSSSRAGYANGSLAAARFLMNKNTGQFNMADVLGLDA